MAANIQREFETIVLGDERREDRIRLLAARFAAAPGASVSAASQDWAEAMAGYRLARSAHVTFEKVMAPHQQATIERARLHLVEELDLSHRPIRARLGQRRILLLPVEIVPGGLLQVFGAVDSGFDTEARE